MTPDERTALLSAAFYAADDYVREKVKARLEEDVAKCAFFEKKYRDLKQAIDAFINGSL